MCYSKQLSVPNVLKSGWQDNIHFQKYRKMAANGGREISGPLLMIQGADDPEYGVYNLTWSEGKQGIASREVLSRLLPDE